MLILRALLPAVCFLGFASAADPSNVLQPMASKGEISLARQRIETSKETHSIKSPGQVVVVYFTPNDRDPAKDHVARIRRIVEETAGFYQKELDRHGFPDRTMNLLRDEDGQVEIIDVVGTGPDREYGKPDGGKIRQEAVAVLRQRKINPEQSVLLIFCNLMDYDPVRSTISHHSPYYGGGGHLSGNAWQCDSEILDPRRFLDKAPLQDGEYGAITIGRHNSIFIGGVIHELGHAISLPHCRERKDEALRGKALMGSGNRTYGEQLRGEGLGTFLTQAHAFRLAAHCVFNERCPSTLYDRAQVEWNDLDIRSTKGHEICIKGKVTSSIPIHGVVAYFDPAGGSDYDATTASAVPSDEGEFVMCGEQPVPGRAGQLRIVTCHVNGDTTRREFSYRVSENGTPDLSAIHLSLKLEGMIAAIRTQKFQEAESQLKRVAQNDESIREAGQRVLSRFVSDWQPISHTPSQSIASLDQTVLSVKLSHIQPLIASVGWIKPTYDSVPGEERLLSLDGDYFANGLYAHAPAKHEYAIDGKWSRFVGRCGLQTNHPGNVDFEILGDQKLLWRKRNVNDGESASFDVDLKGIKTLTLLVTEGRNGTSGDWGVWIEPTLSR